VAFIPYNICDESLLEGEAKSARLLEGIYHKGQNKIWDGNTILDELLTKHGSIRIKDEHLDPLVRIFSIILWGELVAWKASLQLGAQIEDFSAKLAVTSQAHDEARHFYVMRDYLKLLGREPVVLPDSISRVLTEVMHTKSLAKKLLGMQLMIEPIALTIFKYTRKLQIEPVLTDLLSYYEKDEARHVALGIQYLPRLMKKMNKFQLASLIVWQAKIINAEMAGLKDIEGDIISLGLDPLEVFEYAERKQMECLELALLELGIKNAIWKPARKMVEFRKNLTFYTNENHSKIRKIINSFLGLFR
jgi:hypothetical protein